VNDGMYVVWHHDDLGQNHRQAAETEASIPIATSRPESSPSMMRPSIDWAGQTNF
jgi:hypothetical protein